MYTFINIYHNNDINIYIWSINQNILILVFYCHKNVLSFIYPKHNSLKTNGNFNLVINENTVIRK